MGYLSCNAHSAVDVCDPYNWDRHRNPTKIAPFNLPPIRHFLYSDLVAATHHFDADSFLGKGSHGSVYKAVLDDGKLIAAVKRTTATITHSRSNCRNCSCNGPADNEIEILSQVRNPRIVNLIGVCEDPKQNKLIVVEYMPNGSLYNLLHSSLRPPGWVRRVRFALQVAKAVHALHSASPPVIHRDIKSSNVLIDAKGNARLGDFGLALRGHVEDVRVKCTPPAGTLGYLDPGYLAPTDVSSKSDVFSFGILLLEIISGRNAIDLKYSPPSVVDWAVPLVKRGNVEAICDERVGSPVDLEVIRMIAFLAVRCVRSSAQKRPGMSEVVECLKGVKKRVDARQVWSKLRRRVGGKERSRKARGVKYEALDESVELVRVSSNSKCGCGSRRSSRKVSSVTGVEKMGGGGVVRSRSVGSFGVEEADGEGWGELTVFRRKKTAVVRLSKSRSMGVKQSPKLVANHRRKITMDLDLSKLVISGSDEKFERKILEKPLFSESLEFGDKHT